MDGMFVVATETQTPYLEQSFQVQEDCKCNLKQKYHILVSITQTYAVHFIHFWAQTGSLIAYKQITLNCIQFLPTSSFFKVLITILCGTDKESNHSPDQKQVFTCLRYKTRNGSHKDKSDYSYLNVIVFLIENMPWSSIMFEIHSSSNNTICQDDAHYQEAK